MGLLKRGPYLWRNRGPFGSPSTSGYATIKEQAQIQLNYSRIERKLE
jgi:hypothetical protein